ncbi:PQQ-dependent sugar dehydrogenase [Alloalcanivorax marinus]|uniref:PQQ-dependent sugar dehydrogenase n=1 Tax=Alloalcanivorax marinus TaxID=1177169 RepID=UPI00195A980D|nr:PQQ-dependent sugar dehydrogenase [Alloalcanivorax marinus]MBM7333007.1 PQQ-dependent sugar dehydrogenase [Alloalcanivorax marinus]
MPSRCHAPSLALFAALMAGCAGADAPLTPQERTGLTATPVVEGLAQPWSLAFLPDGEWLVTERGGALRRIVDGQLRDTPVTGVPAVVAQGQGGLFDVLPHPRFADNRQLYLSYAKACGDGGATTAVGRGVYRDGELRDFQDLFVAESACTDTAKHFGGRIVIDDDGYLFLTIGDRGQRERAQDNSEHGGSVLRLHDDGRVPEDNPLVGDAEARPEIWSWGHRNPQGLALHPDSGEPWLNEHGPRGGDEINRVEAGVNYGWPVITYGREYYGPSIGQEKKDGYAQPLHYWTPSIAPSGMVFVTSERYPGWRGDVLSGALKLTHLNRVRFDGLEAEEELRYLTDRGDRIRDVRQGPDGHLYLLTDSPRGALLRLTPPEAG